MAGETCFLDKYRTYSSTTKADAKTAELLSLAERDTLFVIQLRTWRKNFGDIYLLLLSQPFLCEFGHHCF